MLQIAICDDNEGFAIQMENLLLQEAKRSMIDIETHVFIDGDELVSEYREGIRFDFVYLDIEMKRVDGKEAARQIREMDKTAPIIYVSSYEQHCKELFVFEPVRYLSKPLELEQFHWTFVWACKRVGYTGASFGYSCNKKEHEVLLKDIIYFESQNNVVYIHLVKSNDGERPIEQRIYKRKLDAIEKELKQHNGRFLRIDRSLLVNYDHLFNIDPPIMMIKNGDGVTLPLRIAKGRHDKVLKQLAKIHNEGW